MWVAAILATQPTGLGPNSRSALEVGEHGNSAITHGFLVVTAVGSHQRGTLGIQGHGVVEGVEQVMLETLGEFDGGCVNPRPFGDAELDVLQILQVVLCLLRFFPCKHCAHFRNTVRRLEHPDFALIQTGEEAYGFVAIGFVVSGLEKPPSATLA
ncbi:hypothetical protein MTYM_01649 [Methylococcales bacterium]|nr:hypothetical protein MTYM_01649 [Methylococcales bacterium]